MDFSKPPGAQYAYDDNSSTDAGMGTSGFGTNGGSGTFNLNKRMSDELGKKVSSDTEKAIDERFNKFEDRMMDKVGDKLRDLMKALQAQEAENQKKREASGI